MAKQVLDLYELYRLGGAPRRSGGSDHKEIVARDCQGTVACPTSDHFGRVHSEDARKSASLDSSHNFGQWPPHLITYKRRGTDPIREYHQRMLVFQEIETYRKRIESEEEHQHQQINAMERKQQQEQLQMTRPMDNKNSVIRRKGPMHFCTPIARISASRIL
uniref:Uncharacterized protein n=1 Tax=Globodera pallida TaxID=36090 RepID=A0A183BR46_GLOPA